MTTVDTEGISKPVDTDADGTDTEQELTPETGIADECNDGYWHWQPDDGGIYLSVWPPRGRGRKVAEAEIKQEFSARGIKQADWQKINAVLQEAKGNKVLIAPPQEGIDQEVSRVTVIVTRDKMKAFVRAFGPTGEQDIADALNHTGVSAGIDQEAIAEVVRAPDPHTAVSVAKGQPPVHGEDAVLEFKFRTDMVLRPIELEDGRVDFYNLNIVENVNQGQELAVKIPASPGQPGKNVYGEELAARPGRDVQLRPGKNTELVDDDLKLVAAAAGHVALSGNSKVVVWPVYEVKGDVDLATGNIKFVGTVIVTGNVTAGTSVTADADVKIGGHVEGAEIRAGGHIAVRRGIQGKNRAKVVAGGDVTAMFVENSDISAGGSVHIGEAVMHSMVSAGRRVTVDGKKGLIVGGKVRARDEIVATTVGSPLGTITELEVGVPPTLRVEFNELSARLKQMEYDLDQAKKNAATLKAMIDSKTTVESTRQNAYLKLLGTQSTLARQTKEMEQRHSELEELISGSETGRVKVKQLIYPGVKVTMGHGMLHCRDHIPGGTLYLTEGEIRVIS